MQNPTNLVFNDADYAAFLADGTTPAVTDMLVNVTPTIPPGPTVQINIGKPLASPDGAVRYPLAGTPVLDAIQPRGGAGTLTIQAHGPSGLSPDSNSVSIERSEALAAPSLGTE